MNVLNRNQRMLAYVIVHALICWMALWLMPGAPVVMTIAVMELLTVSAIYFYRCQPFHLNSGEVVIAIASALISVMIIANVYYFTTYSGGTDFHPVLNNFDALRNWRASTMLLNGVPGQVAESHGFYPYIYSFFLWFTGPSVTAASLVSMMLILASLVLTGKIAYNLSRDKKVALVAMILTASVCYWLHAGAIIVKDAWVITAMALAGVALSRVNAASLYWMAGSVVMLFLGRPNSLLMLICGLILLWYHYRRDKERRQFFIQSIVLCVLAWVIITWLDFAPHVSVQVVSDYNPNIDYGKPNQQGLLNIVGTEDIDLWHKLLYLPLSCVVQFFIPFPWNFMRDTTFGFSYMYAHFGYPWYLFGGLVIYYLIFMSRGGRGRQSWFLAWAVICWLIPCFMFGGTISRYALPTVALFAPFAAMALLRDYKNRRFKIFFIIFVVLIAITLSVAYHLQMSAMAS
jgi:hypothetical protein